MTATAIKKNEVPHLALALLSGAIMDFLSEPERVEKFDGLDWTLRVALAKWDQYAIERRVLEASKTPMPSHSPPGDR